MDYKLTYETAFEQTHKRINSFIKKELLNFKEKEISFQKANDSILKTFNEADKNSKFKKDKLFVSLYNNFKNGLVDYEKNSIENSLKFNVLPIFNKLETEKYKFEIFIAELADYISIENTYRIYNNNNSLISMIYKSSDFTKFELKEYSEIIETTKVYNYYRDILYPHIDNIGKKRIELKLLEKVLKQEFDDNEQAIILNLCLEDNNDIPLTEKVKLIILIGRIEEVLIFEQSSSNNQFYHKVSHGTSRKGSRKSMIDTIQIIIKKIESYNLHSTTQRLKILKSNLISEQNKAK